MKNVFKIFLDMQSSSKLVLYSELGFLLLSLTLSKSGEGIKRLLSCIVSLCEPVQKVSVVNIKENHPKSPPTLRVVAKKIKKN